MRKLTKVGVSAASSVLLLLTLGVAPALAATGSPATAKANAAYVSFKVVDQSKADYVNKTDKKVACIGSNRQYKCTRNVSISTRTLREGHFGLKRGWVSLQLKWKDELDEKISSACNIKVKRGETIWAAPAGIKKKYRIRKSVIAGGRVMRTEHSPWRYSTTYSGISCWVSKTK